MAAELVAVLIRATLGGSLAIIAVMLLRRPIRFAFGSIAAYRLWLLAPVAAAASLLPPRTAWPTDEAAAGLAPTLTAVSGAVGESLTATSWPWLLTLWAAGVAASLAVMAVRQRRFVRALGAPTLDEEGLPLLHALDGFHVGPAVVGAFNPRIVLPANFAERYTEDERRLVLAHERAHLFAHDAQVNAIAALILCLNWFNPLAHLAWRLLRVDQELAADAAVVAQFPNGQKTYAEAILKTEMAALSLPLGCQWPTRAGHPLRERIALVGRAAFTPGQRRLGGAAVALLALVTGAAAWAAQPPSGLLTAGGGEVIEIWTAIKSTVPGKASGPSHLIVASGEDIERRFRLADGRTLDVTLSPRTEGAAVAIRVEVRDGATLLAEPRFLLQDGEPGIVRLDRASLVVTARARAPLWR